MIWVPSYELKLQLLPFLSRKS